MPVPTALTLVTGASPAARERCISALLGAVAPGASCAVILEGLADAASPLLPDSHLSVARIAGGCLCCAGNLVLRVTLNRLLRNHPDRVYIGVGSSDHLDQLRSWLASAPYDQLLELADDVHASP
ncbi:GTPase [Massilia sp. S19_KUP03_FR1]|uniref:GTPase n=1 Tax=Massilia sp. S19_KUP03_FR1 TaxID=3025503 RepID=UPI002FCD4025